VEQVEPDIIYPPGKNLAVLRDGTLLPTGPRGLSPSEIVSSIREIVARKYKGEDESKWGMSLLEASLVAAAEKAADGDLDALSRILDRLMGKPIQQTITASGTLKEFLDELANSDTPTSGGIDPLSN
jgi:hypothetical protein